MSSHCSNFFQEFILIYIIFQPIWLYTVSLCSSLLHKRKHTYNIQIYSYLFDCILSLYVSACLLKGNTHIIYRYIPAYFVVYCLFIYMLDKRKHTYNIQIYSCLFDSMLSLYVSACLLKGNIHIIYVHYIPAYLIVYCLFI